MKVRRDQTFKRPYSASWLCVNWQFVRFCQFIYPMCERCGQMRYTKRILYGITQTVRSLPDSATEIPTTIKPCIYYIWQGHTSVPLRLHNASDIALILQVTWKRISSPQLARSPLEHSTPWLDVRLFKFSFRDYHCTVICSVACSNNADVLRISWTGQLHFGDVPINSFYNSSILSFSQSSLPFHSATIDLRSYNIIVPTLGENLQAVESRA